MENKTTYYRITTVDNPFDPFTQWDLWYNYDYQMGYKTCEQLAALVSDTTALSDEENNIVINDAIMQMLKTHAINKNGELVNYKRVTKES